MTLWHAFQGAEEEALLSAVADYNRRSSQRIRAFRRSPEYFIEGVEEALAAGRGPDLFIWAHDVTGSLARRGLIAPMRVEHETVSPCAQAVSWNGESWGFPFAFETLILYYNKDLVAAPPATTDEMIRIARRIRRDDPQRYGLVYDRTNLYYHAAWLHGFGGDLLGEDGVFDPTSAAMIRSLKFARDLVTLHGIAPDTADRARQIELFNGGRAGMLISGPWLFGLLDREAVDLGIAPLPIVSATGRPAAPFLGVKTFFLSATSHRPLAARRAAEFLASPPYVTRFAILSGALPAEQTAYDYCIVTGDYVTLSFKEQVGRSRLMPNRPEMRQVWPAMMSDPGAGRRGALERILLDGEDPATVLRESRETYRTLSR